MHCSCVFRIKNFDWMNRPVARLLAENLTRTFKKISIKTAKASEITFIFKSSNEPGLIFHLYI